MHLLKFTWQREARELAIHFSPSSTDMRLKEKEQPGIPTTLLEKPKEYNYIVK